MKSVFFDWDGTLVDSLSLLFSAHNHVRETLGYPLWTREEYAKALVYSTRELYPKLYAERALEAQEMLYAFIHANHLKHLRLIDGAKELLEAVVATGAPMGLVSNKRNDVLRREVEHLGWEKYFDVYLGAGVAEKDKPSGAPLLYALAHHSAKPQIEHVLYVGDTESDLGCAQDAGCKVAFLMHEPHRHDLVAKYAPAYTAHNLADLKDRIMEYLAQ